MFVTTIRVTRVCIHARIICLYHEYIFFSIDITFHRAVTLLSIFPELLTVQTTSSVWKNLPRVLR